jgi:hypothetical protein
MSFAILMLSTAIVTIAARPTTTAAPVARVRESMKDLLVAHDFRHFTHVALHVRPAQVHPVR